MERLRRRDNPDGQGLGRRYLYNTSEIDSGKRGVLEHGESIPNGGTLWSLLRYVNDSYETKAFIARPRSKAVGAVDASSGNRPSNMQHVNMNAAPYNFDDREDDHSGQFNRRIQEVDELYREISVRAGFIQPQ